MTDFLYEFGFSIIDRIAHYLGKAIKSLWSRYCGSRVPMTLHGSRFFLRLGGLSGVVALSMAAYGAYAFEVQNQDGGQLKKIYKTGYKMQLVQPVALVCSPLCNRPTLTGGLFTIGILLFSGSCYAHAMTGNTSVRYIIPCGGATLILAWLSMLL